MPVNRNGGKWKKKKLNVRFRDDDTDRLSDEEFNDNSDEIELPSSSKLMPIFHQFKNQYACSTRMNDFYDEEYICDDEEYSIQEDHDYISIDNNDSDDEDFESQPPRRFKAHGQLQPLPDVVIYAYLSNSSSTTPNLALNVLNNVKENLTTPQIKNDYYSSKGISVVAPHSGHEFNLKAELPNTGEKPVTTARCTFQSNPNDDDERQKIALTIMNMIENVISKGGPLNLKTTNVFAAKITALYVEKLRKTGLEFDFNPPKGMSLDDNSNEVKNAIKIFGEINTAMQIETLKTSNPTPPWYAAATKACEPKASNKLNR
ncbi:MAG: hypothetical protein EBQ95_01760 [Gammaproteobacteria bacterium]|nr:hypothetical protein [Gammaproteobacteria bacterium]